MADIKRDNRITSLNARTGIRNTLVTILDQLQRCQRSLIEFLEVQMTVQFSIKEVSTFVFKSTELIFFFFNIGKALSISKILFHWR